MIDYANKEWLQDTPVEPIKPLHTVAIMLVVTLLLCGFPFFPICADLDLCDSGA